MLFDEAMNAIILLKAQHKKVRAALEKGAQGKLDAAEAKKFADELVAHMVIEEHVFYPRARQLMKELVSEAFEEHTVARFALARCLTARGVEESKTRFTVLKEILEHHIEEEETEMFPKLQKGIDAEELKRLGERMGAMFDKAVEMHLESLVSGATHDLRSPDAGVRGMNGGAGKTMASGRGMRATR